MENYFQNVLSYTSLGKYTFMHKQPMFFVVGRWTFMFVPNRARRRLIEIRERVQSAIDLYDAALQTFDSIHSYFEHEFDLISTEGFNKTRT